MGPDYIVVFMKKRPTVEPATQKTVKQDTPVAKPKYNMGHCVTKLKGLIAIIDKKMNLDKKLAYIQQCDSWFLSRKGANEKTEKWLSEVSETIAKLYVTVFSKRGTKTIEKKLESLLAKVQKPGKKPAKKPVKKPAKKGK